MVKQLSRIFIERERHRILNARVNDNELPFKDMQQSKTCGQLAIKETLQKNRKGVDRHQADLDYTYPILDHPPIASLISDECHDFLLWNSSFKCNGENEACEANYSNVYVHDSNMLHEGNMEMSHVDKMLAADLPLSCMLPLQEFPDDCLSSCVGGRIPMVVPLKSLYLTKSALHKADHIDRHMLSNISKRDNQEHNLIENGLFTAGTLFKFDSLFSSFSPCQRCYRSRL